MNDEVQQKYWKSLSERDRQTDLGAAASQGSGPPPFNRRRFLEAAGFTVSLAAIGGCNRAPEKFALPFAVQPPGMVPGRMRSYASTCAGCPAGCGLLAGVRDGRPLKMEGMPEHPLSHGGLCAIGQALPLELYDSHRLRAPLRQGQPASWEAIDGEITRKLSELKEGGGAIRFLTSSVTSPTLKANIDAFLEPFDDARHITFDAVSSSAILDAHLQTHGVRALPHYKLDQARVIVSFGADFLGTWISPVEFTAAWRTRRAPTAEHPEMSFHAQLEGRLSLTGSNADQRFALAPNECAAVLNHLAVRLAQRARQTPLEGDPGDLPIAEPALADLVERLWNARGASLILCDSQDLAAQRLVNYLNHVLDNYGKTLGIQLPSRQRQGNDAEVLELLRELKAGKVAALFVAGVDLTYNLPQRDSLHESIDKVPLLVSFAERENDFTSSAHYVCPDHHPLESWLDAEPIAGLVSIAQPTLAPLGDTRPILESLARWAGRQETAREIMVSHWKTEFWDKELLPRAKQQQFQAIWDQTVHDGFVELSKKPDAAGEFQLDAVKLLEASPPESGYALALYHKVGLTDSRHAQNPWLQELPDPVTKITWDNYVCVAPAAAEELGLTDGDLVAVETNDGERLELPALIQPGQHPRVLAIALAYGVPGTDRFANIGPDWIEARPTLKANELVGKNAAGLIEMRDGAIHHTRSNVKLSRAGGRRELACTQDHHSLEVPPNVAPHGAEFREPIQETTLGALKNPRSGEPVQHHPEAEQQLWAEDHPKTGHWWGMVVDLNACTGCSACLIACQSENNVPVVGKDEVRRHREMHWIRVDRYYSDDGDSVEVSHQPMMCQHCDNAPCETVCPVLATVHGEEGLNQQAYNRCVGTRYCANNCPYKVRRFNWFKYDAFFFEDAVDDSPQSLALNPDVTVRGRGVMEKCSMCVQRIQDGKLEAKRQGRSLADGDIQTACQQSCPAQAIVFGDMNQDDVVSKGVYLLAGDTLKIVFGFPNSPRVVDLESRDETVSAMTLKRQAGEGNTVIGKWVVEAATPGGQPKAKIVGDVIEFTADMMIHAGTDGQARENAYRLGDAPPKPSGDQAEGEASADEPLAKEFDMVIEPKKSAVRAALEDPRRYRVLEEFNFRPSVAYLRVVKNRDAADSKGGEHV